MAAPKNNVAENKPQPSLIPLDLLIEVLEPAYREGVIKYKRESWREGFNTTVVMDAALRHLNAFFHLGEELDKDALKLGIEKHHLGGAIFSLLCMYLTISKFPEMDDRPITLHRIEEKKPKPVTAPQPAEKEIQSVTTTPYKNIL